MSYWAFVVVATRRSSIGYILFYLFQIRPDVGWSTKMFYQCDIKVLSAEFHDMLFG